MNLLLDTNVFLEVILGQKAAPQARLVLDNRRQHGLFVSDYAFHSIGLLLFRRGQHDVFEQFANDLLRGSITLISLRPEDAGSIVIHAQQFGLDFDDAYQYTVAERHELRVVSFDGDFDRTTRGRLKPSEVR